jgi:hypothetical protein
MLPFLVVFCGLFNCIMAVIAIILIIGGVGACSNPANGNIGVWIFLAGAILGILSFYPIWW